jgi:hypothetical protein
MASSRPTNFTWLAGLALAVLVPVAVRMVTAHGVKVALLATVPPIRTKFLFR